MTAPVFVGGTTATSSSTTTYSVSLTSLTGGIDSAPSAGDLVIVATGFTSASDGNPGVTTSGYTEVADLYYAGSSLDPNLSVNYKIMGSTPDTDVVCNGTATESSSSRATIVQVWRNVDPTTPMDAAAVTGGSTSGAASANSGAITPVTSDAVVISCIMAATLSATTAVEPSGYGNTTFVSFDAGIAVSIGMSSKSWSGSGPEDPSAWALSGYVNQYAYAAVTLALRPYTAPAIFYQALNATSSATASLGRKTKAVKTAVSSVVSTIQRKLSRLRAVSSTAQPVIARRLGRIMSRQAGSAPTLAKTLVVRKAVSAISTAVTTRIRRIARKQSVMSAAIATRLQKLKWIMSLSGHGVVELSKSGQKYVAMALLAVGSPLIRRKAAKVALAVSTASVSVSRRYRRALSAVAGSIGRLVRRLRRMRSVMVATSPWVLRTKIARKMVAGTSGSGRIVRRLRRQRSVVTLGAVSINRARRLKRSMATASAAVAKVFKRTGQRLAAISSAIATARHRLKRVLLATATGIATRRRAVKRAMKATAIAMVRIGRTKFRSLLATSFVQAAIAVALPVLGWIAAGFRIRESIDIRSSVRSSISEIRKAIKISLGGRSE